MFVLQLFFRGWLETEAAKLKHSAKIVELHSFIAIKLLCYMEPSAIFYRSFAVTIYTILFMSSYFFQIPESKSGFKHTYIRVQEYECTTQIQDLILHHVREDVTAMWI